MKHEIYEMKIPQWALCAIVNGDSEGLTDDEEKKVDSFCSKYGTMISWDEESYFSHYNDIDGYLGATVYDCEVLVQIK